MKSLHQKQVLPITLDTAWSFFSDPGNLQNITPENMDFRIIFPNDQIKMFPGMILQYKVRLIFNISMTWLTEITQVREPFFFIDSQLKGPYKFWHHQHHFREVAEGVEMEDILFYEVPGGVFGKLLEKVIIEKRVEGIFNYRAAKLKMLFS